MVLLDDLSRRLKLNDPEEKRILTGVTWPQYEALLAELGDRPSHRVAFLDGVLEIVVPSRRHEQGKTQIGTFLELFFLETDTEYFPTGSTTLRNLDQQAGGEPDESYCIGSDKDIPDLVIEVVVSSGGINRLDLFRRLGVREVWFWQTDQFQLYHLREQPPAQFTQTFGYELINQSELLPTLDINLLTECLKHPNPLAAVKRFREWVRSR
jgi:Uma2 family endonuclease